MFYESFTNILLRFLLFGRDLLEVFNPNVFFLLALTVPQQIFFEIFLYLVSHGHVLKLSYICCALQMQMD